jgi:DNA-binding HxlR family transcriptional regulator
MRRTKTNPDFICPVDATLHVIGGKWKSHLLFRLHEHGTLRFNQFRRMMPRLTLQALTNALRELEADGIVHREVYAQVPPKVEYSLTELGRTLTPILRAMGDWGAEHGPALGATVFEDCLPD